jgi:hypothetical protein
MVVVDLDLLPMLLVQLDEVLVPRVGLVDVVAFDVVKHNAQADVVAAVDDVGGRSAGMPDHTWRTPGISPRMSSQSFSSARRSSSGVPGLSQK